MKIRIVSSMCGSGNSCGVTIEGMTKEELDHLLGAFKLGVSWISVADGRLVVRSIHEELPSPVPDLDMAPFWRRWPGPEGFKVQMSLFPDPEFQSFSMPGIVIRGLCAGASVSGAYSEELYAKQGALLESFGFICLRSRRGDNGRFWEMWYLSGLFSSRGDLAAAIKDCSDLDGAARFLMERVDFGSLEFNRQYAALCADA